LAEGIADVSRRDIADDAQVKMGCNTRAFRGRKGGPESPPNAMGLRIYLNDSSGTHSGKKAWEASWFTDNVQETVRSLIMTS
jgi:hypothetical protein